MTGIVLTADHRCVETHVQSGLCRSSDWALYSGINTYLLYGDIPTLKRFERKRVKVSGLLQEERLVYYGESVVRRSLFVSSMESSELSENEIEMLVGELKMNPWQGPMNMTVPTHWFFSFTPPMLKLLQAGRGAQQILLRHIDNQDIQDQIVILLGGVGDEEAIPPIIELMSDGGTALDTKAKRLNLVGNLALTNLTVSEVVWHHGGGLSVDACPDTPRSCWSRWWSENRGKVSVGIDGDRLYSNYPNYGIYAQFGDISSQ